jgi:hypothetical protein
VVWDNIGAIFFWVLVSMVGLLVLTVVALGVAWAFWLLIGLFPGV